MNIDLSRISTRAPEHLEKEAVRAQTKDILKELGGLQDMLYAEARHAVLVVVQGLDASGKDGLSRKVFSHMNPQGVQVTSFKVPSAEELSHDFLWRVHRRAPARGRIRIFNRSHYEDVIVTRVNGLIDDERSRMRMDAINDFERLLHADNATEIIKIYLHVSRERQLERVEERRTTPEKMWKHSPQDVTDIGRREAFIRYYEEVFRHCSEQAWHIVPADQNWYKEYLVAKLLRDRLLALDMRYPGLKQP